LRKLIVPICVLAFFATAAEAFAELDCAPLKTVPVMGEGGLKPLDTFAREFAVRVAGRESHAGLDHMQLLLAFLLDPEKTCKEPLVYVGSGMLREKLALPAERTHFAFSEIVASHRLSNLLAGRGLSAEEIQMRDDAAELATALGAIAALPHRLRVVPPSGDSDNWLSLFEIKDSQDPAHVKVRAAFDAMRKAYAGNDREEFLSAGRDFAAALKAVNPGRWPRESLMSLEALNNEVRPLEKAWILYFAGVAVAGLLFLLAKGRLRWLPLAAVICALLLHAFGIAVRALAAGRAPLGDMYESVVFTAWVISLLGLIAALAFRRIYFAWIGAVMAGAALLAAELLPGGSAAQPVALVLRNDFWLTVHVATVLLGFGAFALAAGAAHYAWGVYCFKASNETLFNSLSSFIRRVIKAGVVFLIAGTVMGGFWASEAWGRFWGWDSKESWALITILIYMIVLHARSCGWLREFGMVLGAMWGFLVVLMTWYGVNYILGVGLHSYGFGRGGDVVVLLIAVAEIVLIFAASSLRASRIANALQAGQPLGENGNESAVK